MHIHTRGRDVAVSMRDCGISMTSQTRPICKPVRSPLGLKPSRASHATSQRDSPIWIQPRGASRYKIIPNLANWNLSRTQSMNPVHVYMDLGIRCDAMDKRLTVTVQASRHQQVAVVHSRYSRCRLKLSWLRSAVYKTTSLTPNNF